MAGIGFALRDLMRQDSLWAILESQLHGVVAVAGPWFFTIVTMALPGLMFEEAAHEAATTGFVTLLLYVFSTSLVLTGPLTITLTRHVSDELFALRRNAIATSFVGALIVGFLLVAPVAVTGVVVVDLPLEVRLHAAVALGLVTVNWIAAPMLSTLQEFRLLTLSYALGTGLFWWLLRDRTGASEAELLLAFNAGMAVTNAVICGLVLQEFSGGEGPLFGVLAAVPRYWQLALGGLLYGLGIWVDKWLMWTAPEHSVSVGGLASHPTYDTVVFLAYVSTVPALALFIIKAETQLHERCARFYGAIQGHAPLKRLEKTRAAVVASFFTTGRDVALLQGCLTLAVLAVPTLILDGLGMPHASVFMFRFCVIGAAFHLGALLITVVLYYFDSRRTVLIINGVFLVSNFVFTALSLKLGMRWYGLGYFLAGVVTFGTAYALLSRTFDKLLFLAFVRQNPAVVETTPRPALAAMHFDAKTATGPGGAAPYEG